MIYKNLGSKVSRVELISDRFVYEIIKISNICTLQVIQIHAEDLEV